MSLSMAAAAEQPLKKRKLYESAPTEPPPTIASPPSQEEILRKRRNREEIRNIYECYRRIRYCISQKDARHMPEFEQAYLSLITASRGCTSVQRIAAELIPRYASYCPTALEAAAKVEINMYNWSLAIITRGDDLDDVAFQTAKTCIFGLVDISSTASSEAPTSSVIRGICSAVFLNVLAFFISTFEGKDIYQIDGGIIEKIQSKDMFSELKVKLGDDEESALLKLFKIRAVCLLRIFFLCPKNLLAACFELLDSSGPDVGVHKGAYYFIRQVTSSTSVVTHQLDKTNDGPTSCTDSMHLKEYNGVGEEKPESNCNPISGKGSFVKVDCLMGMVISKDSSLRGWILSRYKKLCESMGSEALSELSSSLEGVFESFSELVCEASSLEVGDEDNSDPSKYITHQYLVPKISNSGHVVKHCCSLTKQEASVSDSSNHESESSASVKESELGKNKDLRPDRPSMRKDLISNLSPSAAKRPTDLGNSILQSGNHIVHGDNNQISTNVLSSPKQYSATKHSSSSTSKIVWYSDGDPASMDVFSASKQIWLGSLGHEASETLVRSQFERFGPIENFYFFPVKGFALVEYKNIMDAVKAREYMRGSAPWGSCLRIKFLDIGLGSRGAINGAAIGTSCHVYIGKVPSRWAKDEILHELVKVGLRTPRMLTDLPSESALLLEFETAEEAAAVMSHIRQHRKESSYHVLSGKSLGDGLASSSHHLLVRELDHSVSDEELINAFSQFGELTGWKFIRQSGFCFIDFRSDEAAAAARSYLDGKRFGPTPIRVEFRTSSSGNIPSNTIASPYFPMVDNPVDSSKNRMSQLSSLFASLCAKYNLRQSSSSLDSHISRNYHGDVIPTNTLWIGLPDFASPCFTDDDLMTICKLAVGNVGSVSRLKRANIHRGSCWFVEFNSVDAAITVLKNIRACLGTFFQIEYRNSGIPPHSEEPHFLGGKANASGYLLSHDDSGSSGFGSLPGNHNISPLDMKSEGGIHELVSPRVSLDNHGMLVQSGHAFRPNWPVMNSMERQNMIQNVEEKVDHSENNMTNLSLQDGQVISRTSEQAWMYKKPEIEMQMSAPGTMHCQPTATQGPTPVPPPIQPPSFLRPAYLSPNNSWDMRGPNPPLLLNQIPPGMPHTSFRVNVCSTAPFLPSPVTPLAQMPGNAMQRFDQMHTLPTLPPLASPPPPPPDMPPPLPPSPPPLPQSQPPSVPPPPSSPPPLFQQVVQPSNIEASGQYMQYQWQGVLCKSGVHYCTIFANREETGVCKYANAISEPAEWPAKLDVTQRTDLRHVKSTFNGTPPNKREVCRLLPSSASDHKGLQDFITYLKQRECAGVIKIPAGKSIWARLLFILPYSSDICSMLGIAPHPVECLLGLILPKEKNFEW
ncbi:RNA recognition motif domain-containing protein [Cinnamomum micranthum f. kanehirae]|uniref:RNA recognition motif domain-containing protein n=1 Tax=Cinnamomum micranthum f. kanehirae TaxID=337451 RepID=A0A443NWN4_9MAGN|nr:RNA recognition motif domain-containing protein [Cinnamomum micranthum f. kanehirae]